jgi:tRNA nucleotidyltransferase (CCA-adding enzyme)
LASAITKDVGVSEVDALTSVIELHEHAYLKIPMTDGKVDLVPCIPDARLLAEV